MKKNRCFAGLLVILLMMGIGIFVMPQRQYSSMEKRTMKQNDSITLDSSFVRTSEEVLKDQLYFRDSAMKAYYRMKYVLTRPFGKVWYNGFNLLYLEDNVIETDDGYLMNAIVENTEEQLNHAAQRGYNVNEFDLKYPDIRTYVYFPTRVEELLKANWVPECRNAFTAQLNESIRYAALQTGSMEEFQRYKYKSDTHWTIDGAYQGYCDIITMMQQDYELDDPRQIVNEVEYPYDFRGNISSQLAQTGASDHIRDYELQGIGDYDYYVNGEAADYREPKQKYIENGNDTVYSDYDLYFGDNYFLRVFDYHQKDKPNLLIFADSYTNTNMEWISSHFNQTVIIDLRAIPEDFDLDAYIEAYDIDVSLVMMYYFNLYFNGLMYIPVS